MSERPTGVDLFAGAGGLSLGFEQAGFDLKAAVEIDPIHCAVHKFNFPDCAVFPQSASEITGDSIIDQIGPVDVVFGGAPCQGFSMIGKRVLDDSRNSLVKDFIRIVVELDADYFVFENVKGLTVGRHRKFLDELIEEFDAVGYCVRQPWRVLNARNYGVPQNRERLILLGAKKGIPVPEYPEASHVSDGGGANYLYSECPSCFDALGDLPDAEDFDDLWASDSVEFDQWKSGSEYAKEMRCEKSAHWHYGYKRHWSRNELTSSRRTKHTEISRLRFAETAPGSVEPISRFFRLPFDGVSNTLRAGTDASRGAFTSPRPIHFEKARCVTVREMARLHGFPDWFRLHSTKWHGARQVGNAVPPPLARAIAESVIKAMGHKPSRPRKRQQLGDPILLSMDMSQAAKYWEVPVPIAKRDRKSGAKKRTQKETETARLAAQL